MFGHILAVVVFVLLQQAHKLDVGVLITQHQYRADMVVSSQIVSNAKALLINVYMESGKLATAALEALIPTRAKLGR